MRSIRKTGAGTPALVRANRTPPTTGSQATNRWKGFRAHKPSLLSCLLDEQYGLCCYSEIRADFNGLGHHIEHIVNKSQAPSRTFDYSNLAASALDSSTDLLALKTGHHEIFGGHAPKKQKPYDTALFVTCHEPDCHRFFSYVSDGRIIPKPKLNNNDNQRARYTIELLHLNSPYLVNQRKKWWTELDELYLKHQEEGWNLNYLVDLELTPINGRLNHFFSLTRIFLGPTAEDHIRNNPL
ncbi:retron system putative HNH endonuclease [Pseudomonas viridiflava]|uniref:retron system putative HNH endonuclease n=1 Tax=Pseudomonas viridiflava TaxID=33069 RepID=UPI000F02FDF6|nr:retron system putative HNH endonuclease [Pseudomonas viridiflava]